MKKHKQEQKLIRLFWSSDKEKIQELLKSLNPKYLLGRLEAREWNKTATHPSYFEINKAVRNGKPARPYSVTIKYSGYIFNVSKKTLEDECRRRVNAGEMSWTYDYCLWRSRARSIRFGYNMKEHNGTEIIRYAKKISPITIKNM